MEFIRKQSLLSSIIQIAGAVLGGLSTIFIYPNELRLYGLYGFLTNTASLLVPFISLGFGTVLLRYYPHFSNSEENSSRFLVLFFCIYSGDPCICMFVFNVVSMDSRHFKFK